MTPFLQTYVDQLNALSGELSQLLAEWHDQRQKDMKAREQQQQEQWRLQKRLAAAEETLMHVESVQKDNQRLHDANRQCLEHAQKILEYVKALSQVVHP